MAARSLNKVQLIGNLTRDPELRYTPQGTAVCSFGLATNRYWITETSEKREETEFHRIVAWNKLAELCAQLLFKGRKVFVEGRLQTRQWTAQDGTPRQTTEVVISEMIVLDSKRAAGGTSWEGSSKEPKALKKVPPAEEAAGEKGEAKAAEKEVAREEKGQASSGAGAGDDSQTQAADGQQSSTQPEPKKEEEEKTEVKAEDIPF